MVKKSMQFGTYYLRYAHTLIILYMYIHCMYMDKERVCVCVCTLHVCVTFI